jgi:diguanylate cyclase (GGDEF)-like protein
LSSEFASPAHAPLDRLILGHELSPVFQPIASLLDGEVLGYEALIRGPVDSPLRYPDALFAAARREGQLFQLEIEAADSILSTAGPLCHDRKVFLNISADALVRLTKEQGVEAIVERLKRGRIAPQKIVLEITENDRVTDMGQLVVVAASLRSLGVSFAIDDFGDGRSSMRVWAELQPSYVKIDKFFTRELTEHPYKVQMLRAVVHLSETLGGRIIAEGIEGAEELAVVRDVGISLGQGYFLGLPIDRPQAKIFAPAAGEIAKHKVATVQSATSHRMHAMSAANLAEQIPAVEVSAINDEIAQIFLENALFHALAVVRDGVPVGLINRRHFMDSYVLPFHKERFGKRSCQLFMDPAPILLAHTASVEEMVSILTSGDKRYLTDGFIVTSTGLYLGLGTGEQLVRLVLEHRIEAARHANPLTFLPGNIPITLQIEKLLASRNKFVCCYCDLNHFKPFNDQYGYWRGDEAIRLLARIALSEAANFWDFVGHVGGDDFLILFQSEDWQGRCERVISEFNRQVIDFFSPADVQRGGIEAEDRNGSMAFFPLTTLSIGAVVVEPGAFRTAENVASAAAAAKRNAKRQQKGLWIAADPNELEADPEGATVNDSP